MKVTIGLRVVRGPDWEWEEQDGKEGGVGTVVNVTMEDDQSSTSEAGGSAATVGVQWDCGGYFIYRCGRDSKHDLRVFDTAQIGIVHQNPEVTHYFVCSSCKENGTASVIVGLRWKCFECKAYDLCTKCYNEGGHQMEHNFCRIEEYGGRRTLLPPRANSKRLTANGLFVGAEVERGPTWVWGDDDGGAGNSGELVEIREYESGYRCVGRVNWREARQNRWYHIGHKGKVDLKCKKPASGGHYYPDHLPVLGKALSNPLLPCDQFKPGDTVYVSTADLATFKSMQEGHGGWGDIMSEVMRKVGIVQCVLESGDVQVLFLSIGDYMYTINSKALSVIKFEGERENSTSHNHGGVITGSGVGRHYTDGIAGSEQPPQKAARRASNSGWTPVAALGDKPTLQKLIGFTSKKKRVIDITERIGTKYTRLGMFLLEDDMGEKVDALEIKHLMNAALVSKDIFTQWLQGQGLQPVTWESLIHVLFLMNLKSLAEEIKDSLH